jgi:hypothetical protein
MTLTIELTPEEERRLQAARAKGIDIQALLKGVIAALPDSPEMVEDRTEELFAQWEREDATDDPAEIEAAERELAEFKAAINANRALTGERPVFK